MLVNKNVIEFIIYQCHLRLFFFYSLTTNSLFKVSDGQDIKLIWFSARLDIKGSFLAEKASQLIVSLLNFTFAFTITDNDLHFSILTFTSFFWPHLFFVAFFEQCKGSDRVVANFTFE